MKKLILCILAALLFCLPAVSVSAEDAAASTLPDFSDDFESYEVTGNPIEEDTAITEKWENNVFRGGDSVGMDAHIYNVGHIEYEQGDSGNKVLHLKNTTGADSFFYMGPAGDYRVKDFTVTFKVRFLVEDVIERSWVGISFRKKAQVHYTGTNNLMFVLQRYAASDAVAGNAFSIMNGGDPTDLASAGALYGDRLSITQTPYTVPDAVAGQDMPWIEYKLEVSGNNYKIYADDTLVCDCTFDITAFDYFGYLSLNCCTSNVLIDDFSVTVNDETLPPEVLPIATPKVTLNAEEGRLEWNEVDGAYAYRVTFAENNERTVYTAYCALDSLEPGEYDITVTALSEDTFFALNSEPSSPVHYVVSGESEDNGDEGGGGTGDEGGGCNSSAAGALGGAAAVMAAAACALVLRKAFKRR